MSKLMYIIALVLFCISIIGLIAWHYDPLTIYLLKEGILYIVIIITWALGNKFSK